MFDPIAPYADAAIGAIQVVVSAAVIPTVWAGRKAQGVPLPTSLLLSAGLFAVAACLLSKDLPLAAASTAFGAALWGVVALQRVWRGRKQT